ncbi:MAG: ATP-binding protein [Caldilineaceae bacterium]|nr:ATP-binding protein [Caldilineaceae bacterium]
MTEYNFKASEEAPPDPAATIETLGALGYSTESAVADLIDNSISAGATRIEVILHWNGADSWCTVVDNGRGMTAAQLKQAMTIGSRDPLLPRDTADLGRFGFGLKTASFSQCRELTVGSRIADQPVAYRTWDLDYVRAEGRWLLLTSPPPIARKLIEQCQIQGQGVVVLWRRLTGDLVEEDADVADRRAHQRFLQRVTSLERHLAMTFGRFLLREHNPLLISLNDSPVQGWDPFLIDHPATQHLPPEDLSLRGETISVSPFVLPHRSKLTEAEYEEASGPHGWNAQQGFYVFRSERLIQAGNWFTRSQSKDNEHNLARIAVDVPAALDRDWALDVKKASVRPPGPLATDLKRIAEGTRGRARKVYRSRGTPVSRRAHKPVEPVWRQLRRHGELVFRINRKHPIVVELLENAGEERRTLLDLLRVLEETIPIPLLPSQRDDEQTVAFDTEPDEELGELAERVYERFLEKGLTRQEAKERLLRIEPFNLHPDLVDAIVGTV